MRWEFDPNGWTDFLYWKRADKAKLTKILRLLTSIDKNPFAGIGKPEPLKYELTGHWSRRIDKEHRLVYKIIGDTILIISCRYHYD